ncbi:hypothetical protein [Pedobacter jejuensis]|uniref:Phage tail protein n=1 Tax=Pedobacter jejuensis TaxID=1268550 RepID=A0A3N0BQM6_9SPHI|nr:hypothetical protein [Pedobacter jejuensis]RNL50765.1 hypothetical protein D7004_17915 [Pedobacter jejuensis]
MYILNGINLNNIPFIGGRQENSDIALSGFFDMPSRLGKTSHAWAIEHGIEPYVSAADIALGGYGGRSLSLTGFIKGSNQLECNSRFDALTLLIDGITGLVPLVSNWGTYMVYVNAPVVGERVAPGLLSVKIPMREPVVDMSGVIPASTSSEFGIDGISFTALGGASLKLAGDRWTRTAPKSQTVTVFGKEVAVITKKQEAELILSLGIRDLTFEGLKNKVQNLMTLLKAPGLRNLTYKNDKLRSFFVKDGFQASAIYTKRAIKFCVLEIKIIEPGISGTFTSITDVLGQLITDNSNNTITIRL